MINIHKGQVNREYFTLSELSIPTDPEEYRFELKSENSEAIAHTFTKTPVSSNERGQLFEIEEGVDVTITLEGYYTYEVYQTTANNLVEVGLLRVVDAAPATQKYTDSTKSQVYGQQ